MRLNRVTANIVAERQAMRVMPSQLDSLRTKRCRRMMWRRPLSDTVRTRGKPTVAAMADRSTSEAVSSTFGPRCCAV